MIDDSIKTNKLIGIIQPKKTKLNLVSDLYDVGCLGKITNLKKTDDGRYLIELKGLIRFKVTEEFKNNKPYRECKVNFDNFKNDLDLKKEELKFSELELIFSDFKSLFQKRGYIINWKTLEKQSLNDTINALAMASPFSLEEKQALLETKNLDLRKDKIAQILNTYTFDNFDNTTIQ